MAVGILAAVYMAFVFDVSRDTYVMTNTILGIAMLAFDLALMSAIAFSDYREVQITRISTLMTVFAFLSSCCSLFTYEAYAFAEYSKLFPIMYKLAFVVGSIYYGFFWQYILRWTTGKEQQGYGIVPCGAL